MPCACPPYWLVNTQKNNRRQPTTFAVGSQMLSANTYEPYGGNLKKTEFANGQYVQYTYDEFDRKTQAEYRTVSGNQSSAQVEYYNVKHGSSFYVKIDRTIDYI